LGITGDNKSAIFVQTSQAPSNIEFGVSKMHDQLNLISKSINPTTFSSHINNQWTFLVIFHRHCETNG
jgi:hypothetical protein